MRALTPALNPSSSSSSAAGLLQGSLLQGSLLQGSLLAASASTSHLRPPLRGSTSSARLGGASFGGATPARPGTSPAMGHSHPRSHGSKVCPRRTHTTIERTTVHKLTTSPCEPHKRAAAPCRRSLPRVHVRCPSLLPGAACLPLGNSGARGLETTRHLHGCTGTDDAVGP